MNQDKYELLELTDDYEDEKKHSEFGGSIDELEENNPDSPLFNFISLPTSGPTQGSSNDIEQKCEDQRESNSVVRESENVGKANEEATENLSSSDCTQLDCAVLGTMLSINPLSIEAQKFPRQILCVDEHLRNPIDLDRFFEDFINHINDKCGDSEKLTSSKRWEEWKVTALQDAALTRGITILFTDLKNQCVAYMRRKEAKKTMVGL